MKRIYLILLGLVLGIYMTGCYGDKGNYDYQWIQDIEIEEGVSKSTPSFLYDKAPTFTSWGFVIT